MNEFHDFISQCCEFSSYEEEAYNYFHCGGYEKDMLADLS